MYAYVIIADTYIETHVTKQELSNIKTISKN